jgi:hypothetical protein
MDALQVLGRRRNGLLDRRLRGLDSVHHGVDPRRPLRMRAGIVLAEELRHVTDERERL